MEHPKRYKSFLDRQLDRVQKELDLLHLSEAQRKVEIELRLREREALRSSWEHFEKRKSA